MVEIIEVHEIIVKIDAETLKKYLQTWCYNSGKLEKEDVQELLNTETGHSIEVIKCKFEDKDYSDKISTYKVKYIELNK